MALELPDWNEALKLQWDQPAQPVLKAQPTPGRSRAGPGRVRAGAQGAMGTAQHSWQADDAAGLRMEGLDVLPNALDAEYWLRKAALEEQAGRLESALQVLREARDRDVRPVAEVYRAMQQLGKRMASQPEEVADAGPMDATGSVMADVGNRQPQAARFTPSKTGLTGKALRVPSRFAHTPGAGAAAGQATTAAAGASKTTLTSVLKRLTFSAAKSAQEAAEGAGTPGAGVAAKQAGRHVSFGAGTVSPAVRPAARRTSHVQFQTPQPTIDENEAAESPAPSQVNSVNAGRTPYDPSRLSGLFRKYDLPDTPALHSDDDDDQEEESGLVDKLPSWRALSASVSVSDSIKGLAKKYNSDVDSILGLSSPELSPLAATPLLPPAAKSPQSGGASPAMAPTPHHLLQGWQSNELYESPSRVGAAAAGAAAQQLGASAEAAAAPAQAQAAASEPLLAGEVSPLSGAVHLAMPALDHCKHAVPEGDIPASLAATPMTTGADMDLSPLSLARSHAEDEELAPGGTPLFADGVPRDAAGIPLVTPATVTVARGGHFHPQPFRDDGLAANLFGSFDSPEACSGQDFSFAPAAAPTSSQEQEEEGDTPNLQPRASSEEVEGASDFAFHLSPEILGYAEQQELAAASEEEAAFVMPRSILKSQPVAGDGMPLLGRAQRVPSPTKVPRSATKEVRALMAGLSLEDAEGTSLGTVPMLSPVRAHAHLKAQLGVDKVVTPVRRSVRNQTAQPPVDAMLEQTNYSYVPNEALLPEDALPREKTKSVRKPASKEQLEEKEQEQAAPNTASRGQSLRKSRLGAADSSSAVAEGEPRTEQRRYNTRRSSMYTPGQQQGVSVRRSEAEDAEVFTPPAAGLLGGQGMRGAGAEPAAGAPVPQDASPSLAESPALAGGVGPDPAIAASAQGRSMQKAGRPGSAVAATPVAAAAAAEEPGTQRMTRRRASMAAAAAAAASASPQPLHMSPTELQIRSALRRSARKSNIMRGG